MYTHLDIVCTNVYINYNIILLFSYSGRQNPRTRLFSLAVPVRHSLPMQCFCVPVSGQGYELHNLTSWIGFVTANHLRL